MRRCRSPPRLHDNPAPSCSSLHRSLGTSVVLRPPVSTLNGLPNLLGAFAGENGGPPTVTTRKSVGWLEVDGRWEKVCEDEDGWACVARTQALAVERGSLACGGFLHHKVLPEGMSPHEEGAALAAPPA